MMQRAFLLLLVCFSVAYAGNVWFVDETPKNVGFWNMLFRGGNPDSDGKFDYNQLVTELQMAAKEANKEFPDKFNIIDICFLNDWQSYNNTHPSQGASIDEEFSFFQQNPKLGSFMLWETAGSYDNITAPQIADPPGLQLYLTASLDEWMADQLPTRMLKIRGLLYTKFDLPTIIYGHCDCGCDRTGEMFGSYYMKWMDMTWEDTNQLNTKIANRSMECFNYLAMQWYCLYLNLVEGKNNLNCLTQMGCTDSSMCITYPIK